MTDQEYFALDAISQSDINLFIKNKKEYELCRQLGRGGTTKAMELGSLNHCLLFEPQEFYNRYAHFDGITPSSSNMEKFFHLCFVEEISLSYQDAYVNSYSCKSKSAAAIEKEAGALFHELSAYAKFIQDHGHKIRITSELEIQSRRMIDLVYQHPGVQKTLLAGRVNPNFTIEKEIGIIWEHEYFPGVKLKSKIDELHIDFTNNRVYAYDYKTTRTPNTKAFKGSIKYYGYDIQESFYVCAIQYFLKNKYDIYFDVTFRFIPQLNTSPFNVIDVVQLSQQDRLNAHDRWYKALGEMIDCIETGNWDNEAAYSDDGVAYVTLDDNPIVVLENEGQY